MDGKWKHLFFTIEKMIDGGGENSLQHCKNNHNDNNFDPVFFFEMNE